MPTTNHSSYGTAFVFETWHLMVSLATEDKSSFNWSNVSHECNRMWYVEENLFHSRDYEERLWRIKNKITMGKKQSVDNFWTNRAKNTWLLSFSSLVSEFTSNSEWLGPSCSIRSEVVHILIQLLQAFCIISPFIFENARFLRKLE